MMSFRSKLAVLLALAPGLCLAQVDVVHWSANLKGKPTPGQTVTVEVTAKIDPGWHLYAIPAPGSPPPPNSPTSVTAEPPLALAGPVVQGKPEHKIDPNFGQAVDFFETQATFDVPVKVPATGLKGSKIKFNFQTCNNTTCIPPKDVEIGLDGVVAQAPAAAAAALPPSIEDQIAKAKKQGLFSFALLAFGAGLLALLTPCVFPMVPITVSFFAKRREKEGSRALVDAFVYCLGIVGAFAAFGLIITLLFGASSVQTFATNPWVNVAIGVLFVGLAINLFGYYAINLPSGLANKFSPRGRAGLVAPLLMGLTFTLTSFTCTVPFVGTVLVSAAGGDVVYPLVGMLAFGSAFALPFFLLALFPQFLSKIPKAGIWMEAVKGFMGFLELAAAVKFFSNADLVWGTGILPRTRFLILWVVIGLAAVAFLLGLIKLPHVQLPKQMGKGRALLVGIMTLVVGFLIYGSTGAGLGDVEAYLPPKVSGWLEKYDEAQTLANRTGKPIFINFTGVTCTNCRWMEDNMFPRQDVSAALKGFVTVELFTDRANASDRANQALQQKLTGTVALPVYVVVPPNGKPTRKLESLVRDPQQFLSFLRGS